MPPMNAAEDIEEAPVNEKACGVLCRRSVPWLHFLSVIIMVVGVAFLSAGLKSINTLSQNTFTAGVAVLTLLPLAVCPLVIIAFFETGPCAEEVATDRVHGMERGGMCAVCWKFAGCLLCGSEWVLILITFIIMITSLFMLMTVSFATTTAYVLKGICAGGYNGMAAFCPVVFLVHSSVDIGRLSNYWDISHYCDCSQMTDVTVASGGKCPSEAGWEPGSMLQDMCNDDDLAHGAENACMGCILLIVGTVALMGMSMRSRGRMATKMADKLTLAQQMQQTPAPI